MYVTAVSWASPGQAGWLDQTQQGSLSDYELEQSDSIFSLRIGLILGNLLHLQQDSLCHSPQALSVSFARAPLWGTKPLTLPDKLPTFMTEGFCCPCAWSYLDQTQQYSILRNQCLNRWVFVSLPPPRSLCFQFVCLFVCLFVCQQHNGKTTGLIFTRLCGRVQHGPMKNQLKCGADPNHWAESDPWIWFHFC